MSLSWGINIPDADYYSLLSLEMGRPTSVKDEDCNVGMPSPVDDEHMHSDNGWLSSPPEQSTSLLLPLVQIVGGISKMLRVIKGPHLAPSALEAYEAHFKDCMREFPIYRQIRPNDYVDPKELPPIIYLQNARLVLHRHNLQPGSEAAHRSSALTSCAAAAADTARLLRRCMQEAPPEKQLHNMERNDAWEERMVSAVSSFLCTHIWRCTLFLCFRFEFELAIWCVQASAALGNSRPINTACGQNLEFYLGEMAKKLKEGCKIDADEDMIAYTSGDLQGNLETAWVWECKEGDDQEDYADRSPSGTRQRDIPLLDEANEPRWDRWGKILDLLNDIFEEKQREQQHRAIEESSLRPPLVLPPLAPSPMVANSSNRMSIKDLI